MILVDTSVWVDFLQGLQTSEADRLSTAITKKEYICTCGMVLTELFQGIKEEKAVKKVRQAFTPVLYLPMSRRAFERAADLSRRTRKNGKTVRSTVDCMIASCAIEHRVPLLHRDKDFEIIAEVSALRFPAL
jgi:predicted nucleic acid-binding protein